MEMHFYFFLGGGGYFIVLIFISFLLTYIFQPWEFFKDSRRMITFLLKPLKIINPSLVKRVPCTSQEWVDLWWEGGGWRGDSILTWRRPQPKEMNPAQEGRLGGPEQRPTGGSSIPRKIVTHSNTVELHYSRKNGRRKSFYYIGFFYYFGFSRCSRKLTE